MSSAETIVMGYLHRPPLSGLVSGIADRFRVRHFIETGTFEGDACAWACGVFESVTTIEKSQTFHTAAREKYSHLPITFKLGDSADVMMSVVADLTGPALFWLDGHSGGGYYGPDDDCPLMAELAAIALSPYDHCIIVDDARGFLAPPPPPFVADRWPAIADVLDALRAGQPKYCVVIADTIIAVPPSLRPYLSEFCFKVRPKI